MSDEYDILKYGCKIGDIDIVKKHLKENSSITKIQFVNLFINSCINGYNEIAILIYNYMNTIVLTNDNNNRIIINKHNNINYNHYNKKNPEKIYIDFISLFQIVCNNGYLDVCKFLVDINTTEYGKKYEYIDDIINMCYINGAQLDFIETIINKYKNTEFSVSPNIINEALLENNYNKLLYILQVSDKCVLVSKFDNNLLNEKIITDFYNYCLYKNKLEYIYKFILYAQYDIKYNNNIFNILKNSGCLNEFITHIKYKSTFGCAHAMSTLDIYNEFMESIENKLL